MLNGTPTLIDGNLTIYHNAYSNAVDWNDAQKLSNFGENFGIIRSSTTLVIERRQVIGISDTSIFMMWNMQQRPYQLQLNLQNLNHPNLFAKLVDNYLGSSTEVCTNGITAYNFQVNADPASAHINRFSLVYYTNTTSTIPVDITGIDASRKDNRVIVNWNVANEISIDHYAVEKSMNGVDFYEIEKINPLNNGLAKEYQATDPAPQNGKLFYRIKALSQSGKIQYSEIAAVNSGLRHGSVEVYPNPVVNKTIQLKLDQMEAGEVEISLVNSEGKIFNLPKTRVVSGSSRISLTVSDLSPGIYQLIFFNSHDRTRIIRAVNIL